MTPSAPFDFDTNLDQLYLAIPPDIQDRAWTQSRVLATPASRWRGYLNQLAWQTFQPWLAEALAVRVKPMLAAPLLPTIWEWVEGCSLVAGSTNALRLVLLPTEAMDDEELRVPLEWLEISNWTGDYYIQLQVNPDDGWVKVSGLATHAALLASGEIDWDDRTCSLPAADLMPEVSMMLAAQAIAAQTSQTSQVVRVTQANHSAVEPSALSPAEAQQLITRLSDPSLLDPRMAIDFARWKALMAHGGWRRQMTQQRQGQPPAFSVSQWLQSGVTQLAEQIGWQSVEFQPVFVGARGEDTSPSEIGLVRTIEISTEAGELETYELKVLPVVGDVPNAWRFELKKLGGLVVPGVVLRLLSEDLQPFEDNEVTATEPVEALFLDIVLTEDEGIIWQIEPEPAQYEPEMIRF